MDGTPRGFDLQVCSPAQLPELFALRAQVWIGEGADPRAFPNGQWSDAHDTRRQHWVIVEHGRVVAGASLAIHDRLDDVDEAQAYHMLSSEGPVAAPARVIVAESHRGHGFAVRLLDTQDAAARAASAVLAVRQASPAMVRLLERRGWESHGPAPSDPRFPATNFTVMSLVL